MNNKTVAIQVEANDGLSKRVEAVFRVGGQCFNIFFECDQPVLQLTPEALLVAAYLSALVNGLVLQSGSPSARNWGTTCLS